MKTEKLRIIALVLVAGLLGYSIGVTKISLDWKNYTPHVEVTSKEPPPGVSTLDLSQFWAVMEKLETSYYDKTAIDGQKMLNGAISGMVESLGDPYTVYLPAQENNEFKDGLAGKFEGIGAELGLKGKQIIIVAPLDGSPAQKAGIRPGDVLVKVDNQLIAGWSLSETVNKIRGPKGTPVMLSVQHKAGETPVDVKIVRDTITIKSLTSWTKAVKDVKEVKQTDVLKQNADNKVVYVRLSQFGDTTNDEWQRLANTIARQVSTDKTVRGIVFDLRNNPGGYLNDAVYISSEFIKDGVAVKHEDKNKEQTNYNVSGKGILTDVPLVVLINKGSASASEIVAGALRDHKRAQLVGETSFGKGTIQQAEDLGAGAGLHVTIAKWLTPDGIWVHQKGLTPDVVVALEKKDPERDTQLEKAIETLLLGK